MSISPSWSDIAAAILVTFGLSGKSLRYFCNGSIDKPTESSGQSIINA